MEGHLSSSWQRRRRLARLDVALADDVPGMQHLQHRPPHFYQHGAQRHAAQGELLAGLH